MSKQQPSKWIGIFKENPKQEHESQRMYLKRLAKEYGVSLFTVEKAYQTHVRDKAKQPEFDTNIPVFKQLPKSENQPKGVVQIEGDKVLCLYDVHVPYHDTKALHCAINEGVRRKCDTIFLGGDIVDAYEVSRFEKSKYKRSFREEVQLTKQFFSFLRFKFPKARIYYLFGNHCLRYHSYIRKNASALEGIDVFEFGNLFDFEKFGIIEIPPSSTAKYLSLNLVHGHEWGGSVFSPVNVARGLYMRAKTSAMCGHSHQTSEHTETDMNGKMVTCWSVGCLSELRPDYSKYAKYNHGFAIIEGKGKDRFHVTNYRIQDGEIL
jgi:predicted phosphodiesterase